MKIKKQKEIKQETSGNLPMLVKNKKPGTVYLVIAIVFGLICAGSFAGYFFTSNMIFGYLFIPPGLVAWFFFYRFNKSREQATEEAIFTSKPIPTEQVNSMNIYPLEMGGVVFENMAKPEGQPKICENDGKPYFVHIWDTAVKRLKPFTLPDTQYYDPRVFAERVLELPAHRRIFVRKQSTLQKLSPFFLIILIIALWIANLTMNTGPAPGV